ncbi:hypothetical protein GCM10025856_01490 [Methylophaga marina]|nr:hypothetical protein GCM10025856_01490 [Methylophaga marina]
MKWRGREKSSNIEDRRNQRVSGVRGGSGDIIRLLPAIFRLLGFKGTAILLIGVVLLATFTGNLPVLLSLFGIPSSAPTVTSSEPLQETAEEKNVSILSPSFLLILKKPGQPSLGKMANVIVRLN